MKSEDYLVDDKLRIFNAYRKRKYNLYGYRFLRINCDEKSNRYAICSEDLPNAYFSTYESKEEAFKVLWNRFDRVYPSFEEMELFNVISGEES